MKKIIKVYLIILCLILCPCIINADTYENATDLAETYMSRANYVNNYKKYILITNNDKLGELIDKDSYLITVNRMGKNDYSYLDDGYEYWTNTEKGNQAYVIPNGFKDQTYSAKTRVVETVIHDRKVLGLGTYRDPWIFLPLNKAIFTSNKENTISMNINNYSSNISFGIYPNDTKTIYLNQREYKYRKNSCEDYVHEGDMTSETATLIVNNVIKDFNCEILFAEEYNIVFDKQGGSGGSDAAKAFNDEELPIIDVPTKAGYTFDGYYSESNGNGKKYYNSNGQGVKWDKDSGATLYANWTVNTYTANTANWEYACTPDGYTIRGAYKCANITVGSAPYLFTYSGNCEISSENDEVDGDDSWKIKFKTNGNLVFNDCINSNFETDIFVVGGGAYNGGGGYATTYSKVSIVPGATYNITIGAGGTSSSANGKESSIKKDGTKLYFANGAQGNNGGSGKGSNGAFNCLAYNWSYECEWGGWSNGGKGAAYGNNGGAGTGQLNVTYNASTAPWGGQTTCEFNEGTSSGCKRGDDFAYSSASGGCGSEGSSAGAPGNGLRDANSGAGGNCGSSDKNGQSGVVIIRRKIPKDWQLNYMCSEGELTKDKTTGNIICVRGYTSTSTTTNCEYVCSCSGENFCCCTESTSYHCNNGWSYYLGSGSGTKCYKAAQPK